MNCWSVEAVFGVTELMSLMLLSIGAVFGRSGGHIRRGFIVLVVRVLTKSLRVENGWLSLVL